MNTSDDTAKVTRWLRWFERHDDRFVGEKELRGITLEELQAMFGVDIENPMYDCFKVEAAHVHSLERVIDDRIDLTSFDYFVEADAV